MRGAFVLLVLLLAGCSSPGAPTPQQGSPGAPDATPAAPPPPSEDHVALALGDTWTYDVTGRDGNRSTQTATVAEVRDGSAFVDTSGERPLRTEFDQRTLAIRSITQSGTTVSASASFDPALALLVPAADHEWLGVLTLRTPLGASSRPAHANVTFLGLEDVVVPAGRLPSYHYAMDLESQGSPPFAQRIDVWYAPVAKAYAKQVSGNETQELRSYHVAERR